MCRRGQSRPTLYMQMEATQLAALCGYLNDGMFAAARAMADKGRTQWPAEMHRQTCALLMSRALAKFSIPPEPFTLAAMLRVVDNHSAWRQKFEKEGIFPKSSPARSADDYLAELAEEGVGE